MRATERFMEQFVCTVYEDFCKNAHAWCDLRDFKLHIEDYEECHSQQYYLLKYFPAYFTEYYAIYEQLFLNDIPEILRVASVGCGSGIDFYALTHLLRIKELPHKLEYLGIDGVAWNYLPEDPRFSLANILVSELDGSIDLACDVWFFPKSWTEFSKDDAVHLAKLIGESGKERIHVLNSYITDDAANNQHINTGAFKYFHRELLSHGFETKEKENEYTHWSKDVGYRTFYNFFKYPDDVLREVRALKKSCPSIEVGGECGSCDLKVQPMLRSKYGAWKVFEYHR